MVMGEKGMGTGEKLYEEIGWQETEKEGKKWQRNEKGGVCVCVCVCANLNRLLHV